MARKKRIDYFSFDVDFFDDTKIKFIRSRFGAKGEVITIRLLCEIYGKEGYFMQWDEDAATLFATDAGGYATHTLVNDIVMELLKRGFFDKGIFERFHLLTSHGIQWRYARVKANSSTVDFIEEIFLLDANDPDDLPQSAQNKLRFVPMIKASTETLKETAVVLEENTTISRTLEETGGTLKENSLSKVKESKEKEKTLSPAASVSDQENERRFAIFYQAYPRKVGKPSALKAFRQLNVDDQMLEEILAGIERWLASDQWQESLKSNKGKFIPYPATFLNQRRWEDDIPISIDGSGQTIEKDDLDDAWAAIDQAAARRQ